MQSSGQRRGVAKGMSPVPQRPPLAAVARGADPAGSKRARREADTFAAEEWIERRGRPNKGSRALRDDRSMLDRHILPEIGAMMARQSHRRLVIDRREHDGILVRPGAMSTERSPTPHLPYPQGHRMP